MVRVQVPASTANLGPGFDTLGMALQFYNTVEMEELENGLFIDVEGEGQGSIDTGAGNIVYRAAEAVYKAAGKEIRGLRIRLTNNIPVARGLGSSAAAIVGGILGANILLGKPLQEKELINLATMIEGHPDNVAPALLGGIVISSFEEGEVCYLKIDPPPGLKCVVAIPDFTLSTKAARDVLPRQVSLHDAVFNISRSSLLVASLMSRDLSLLGTAMEDRLHQPYRASLIPGMKKVFAAARLAGAKGVTLSGAGPTLIAFVDENATLVAQVMKETFKQCGVPAKAFELEINPVGARAFRVTK